MWRRAALAVVFWLIGQGGTWAGYEFNGVPTDVLPNNETIIECVSFAVSYPINFVNKSSLMMLERLAENIVGTSDNIENDQQRAVFFFSEELTPFWPHKADDACSSASCFIKKIIWKQNMPTSRIVYGHIAYSFAMFLLPGIRIGMVFANRVSQEIKSGIESWRLSDISDFKMWTKNHSRKLHFVGWQERPQIAGEYFNFQPRTLIGLHYAELPFHNAELFIRGLSLLQRSRERGKE